MASSCLRTVSIPPEDRKWYWFLFWSFVIWLSGLVLILFGRFSSCMFSGGQKKSSTVAHSEDNDVDDGDDDDDDLSDRLKKGWYFGLKEGAGKFLTGQTVQGRVTSITMFICNLTSCALYVTDSGLPIENCHNPDDVLWKVEIILNSIYIFHFIIRFLAANDKLYFWLGEPLTYVDILTVPTVFVSMYLERNWIGLRFTRIINMINFAEILQFLGVLTGGPEVELLHMFGTFLSVWLSSAGMVHLLENTGDFWAPINYANSHKMNFFDCTYFLLVTMSTVGYGDIFCETYLGRLFCMAFIGVGLALFASYLPVISDYMTSHTRFHLAYKSIPGKRVFVAFTAKMVLSKDADNKIQGLFASYIPVLQEYLSSHTKFHQSYKINSRLRHIVVAGHITEESAASFLKDFLHPDRDDHSTMVVFLAPNLPNISMQAVLKLHEPRASYFIGSIYSTPDCYRMQLRKADAVLILCNKTSPNPDEEDSANIARVISVKNFHENCRCVVQLIMNKNKSHLMNCPQWKPHLGDGIVCINELKLGFLAQSCNAPGFSTLVANLFSVRSDTVTDEIAESEQWKVAYMVGASNEVYCATLSQSFVGMTFVQAVEICFEKLDLLLFAIEMHHSKTDKVLLINPNDKKLSITRNTRGFFFSQCQIDANRVTRYCLNCHKDLISPEHMPKCKCRRRQNEDIEIKIPSELDLLEGITKTITKTRSLTNDYYPDGEKPLFDQSGTFFWCENRPFATAKVSILEASNNQYLHHVVVLVLSSRASSTIELRQIVLPLRASNTQPSSLKKIVVLGDEEFLRREWKTLENFPDVHAVPGSPYIRSDLRAVNVDVADMVIMLSPGHSSREVEHQALSDKEVILVTLNLKAMKFDRSKLITHPNKPTGNKDSSSLRPATSISQIPSATSASRAISRVSQAEIVTPSRAASRRASNVSRVSATSRASAATLPTAEEVKPDLQTVAIPMITELLYDSNAMFLDQDDMNIYDDDGIFLTQPYACGSAFTVSVLDSLVSAVYFNADILQLVRTIVTGSVSYDLDELLAEGKQPTGTYETPEIAGVRNRCRVEQLTLSEGLLADFGECGLFGDLFLYALRTYNMICLGLYRFRDPQRFSPKSTKRYVITFPSFNFVLSPSDKVFVLMQFNTGRKPRRVVQKKSTSFNSIVS